MARADGNAVVVILSAAAIVMERDAVAVCGAGVVESVVLTVKVYVPGVAAVPEMAPVALSDNPVGSDPFVSDHEYEGVPPVAVRLVE